MTFLRTRWLAAALVLLALTPAAYLAWTSRDVPHLGYFQDDGLYLIGAKSLVEGSGYRILSLPGQPYQTKYPPLYPLLLSATWLAVPHFPANVPLALLLTWLWLPVLIALSAVYFRSLGFGAMRVTALCAVLALTPVLAFLSSSLMAEVMFSALLLAALLTAERAGGNGAHPALALVAGLIAAAAFLTKTAGLPLLATVPALFLWRRQFSRAALFVAGMLPAVAGWMLWSKAHTPAGGDLATLYYTNYVGFYRATTTRHDLLALLTTNAEAYLRGLGGLVVLNTGDGFGAKLFTRILALVAIAGAARLARGRGVTHFHLFGAAYSMMLIGWNYGPNERFLLPLLPLVWAGFSEECGNLLAMAWRAWTSARMDQRVAAGLIFAAVAALVVVGSAATWRGFTAFLPQLMENRRNALAESRGAFQWIERNTPAEAAFVAYQDTLLYLYTNRTGARLVLSSTPFYHNDLNAAYAVFRDVAGFGRSHGLEYVYVTEQDYDTDMPADQRAYIRRGFAGNPAMVREFGTEREAVYGLAR